MASNISGNLLWHGFHKTHIYLPVKNYGKIQRTGDEVRCHLFEFRPGNTLHATLRVNIQSLHPIEECVFTNMDKQTYVGFLRTAKAIVLRIGMEYNLHKCIILEAERHESIGDEVLINHNELEAAPHSFTYKYTPYEHQRKNDNEVSNDMLRDGDSIGAGQYTPGGA